MHNSMPTKDKRMVVYGNDRSGCSGTNVGKYRFASGISTDAEEVEVMEGWLGIFVKGRAFAISVIEFCLRRGILD